MMYIAYHITRRSFIQSTAHSTREEAARELFTKRPKLERCETAVAFQDMNGEWSTGGQHIQCISRRYLPAPKMTKVEALQLLTKLYRAFNTADHETKADWMTPDLAGENGCALFDKVLQSKAFTDDERQAFLDNL